MEKIELTKQALKAINDFQWGIFYKWQVEHGLDFINLNVELHKASDLLSAYLKKLEE